MLINIKMALHRGPSLILCGIFCLLPWMYVEGTACSSFGSPRVLGMCQIGEMIGQSIYLDVSSFSGLPVTCTCTMQTTDEGGRVLFNPILVDNKYCQTSVLMYDYPFVFNCSSTGSRSAYIAPGVSLDFTVLGQHRVNTCIHLSTSNPGTNIKVTCFPSVPVTSTSTTTSTSTRPTTTWTTLFPPPTTEPQGRKACPTGLPVLDMCQASSADGGSLYVDSSLFTDQYSSCSCTVQVVTQPGETVEVYPLTVDNTNCNTKIYIDSVSYYIGCGSQTSAKKYLPTSSSMDLVVKGRGTAHHCAMLQAANTGSVLRVQCTQGIINTTPTSTTIQTTEKPSTSTTPTTSTTIQTTEKPSTSTTIQTTEKPSTSTTPTTLTPIPSSSTQSSTTVTTTTTVSSSSTSLSFTSGPPSPTASSSPNSSSSTISSTVSSSSSTSRPSTTSAPLSTRGSSSTPVSSTTSAPPSTRGSSSTPVPSTTSAPSSTSESSSTSRPSSTFIPSSSPRASSSTGSHSSTKIHLTSRLSTIQMTSSTLAPSSSRKPLKTTDSSSSQSPTTIPVIPKDTSTTPPQSTVTTPSISATSSTVPKPTDKERFSMTGLIVGLSLALLVVLFIIGLILCYRNRHGKRHIDDQKLRLVSPHGGGKGRVMYEVGGRSMDNPLYFEGDSYSSFPKHQRQEYPPSKRVVYPFDLEQLYIVTSRKNFVYHTDIM